MHTGDLIGIGPIPAECLARLLERFVTRPGYGIGLGSAETMELAIREVNAGTYAFEAGPLAEIGDADLRAQFETNVFGLMAVTRAFLPQMRARRSGSFIVRVATESEDS